jgi:hypothetical protein
LSEEQSAELKALIEEMKNKGATREEIKQAVDALFDEWGIERPPFGDNMGRRPGKNGMGWMKQLTEEQRATIRDMIHTMREDGATREDIREAVKKQLQEWGIGQNDGDENGASQDRRLELQENENVKAANAPNPFNPTTTISFAINEAGPVSVSIYNTKGQLIRTLVDNYAAEGTHSAVWDGLNDQGESVSSGLYFYRVSTPQGSVTERMMLMK